MGNIGVSQLLIIGVVLVVLFGASRLPATAKGLGQALRIFKKEMREDEKPAGTEPSSATGSATGTAPATPTPSDMGSTGASKADPSGVEGQIGNESAEERPRTDG